MTLAKYFGTDGFRGEAGRVLTADHAYSIGRFLGWYYRMGKAHRPRVIIGKDPRLSSYMLEYAIAAGLTASGADAYMLHVITTPGVSYCVRQDDFDCGIMISASHNRFSDNGIKLVNARGEKADDATIDGIEKYLDGERASLGIRGQLPFAVGADIGRIVDHSSGRNRYVAYLISLALNSYKELRIGLDCANGSAWMIAKSVFDALGAKTYTVNASPDGLNINRKAGSTSIDVLSSFVRDNGLDMGFAFDGDADRCLAVDENGRVITGDHILYILSTDMKRDGILSNNTVVTTVMSNHGLFRALDDAGIRYVTTQVGDKYVYENMLSTGNCIGGEQSGHVIMSKYATTGDGILTAIKLTDTVLKRKLPLSKLAEPVRLLPQVLINVPVPDKSAVKTNVSVSEEVSRVADILGDSGRVLLRESGTESVVRVMVEADSETLCRSCAESIVSVIYSEGLAKENE